MATTLKDAMIEDLRRMDEASTDLTMEHRVSLGKIAYWECIAIMHILTWILRDKK